MFINPVIGLFWLFASRAHFFCEGYFTFVSDLCFEFHRKGAEEDRAQEAALGRGAETSNYKKKLKELGEGLFINCGWPCRRVLLSPGQECTALPCGTGLHGRAALHSGLGSWLLQDDYPLASLPLLGYTVSCPVEADGIQKDYVFKLQFKSHVYFFRAESKYTFER